MVVLCLLQGGGLMSEEYVYTDGITCQYYTHARLQVFFSRFHYLFIYRFDLLILGLLCVFHPCSLLCQVHSVFAGVALYIRHKLAVALKTDLRQLYKSVVFTSFHPPALTHTHTHQIQTCVKDTRGKQDVGGCSVILSCQITACCA